MQRPQRAIVSLRRHEGTRVVRDSTHGQLARRLTSTITRSDRLSAAASSSAVNAP